MDYKPVSINCTPLADNTFRDGNRRWIVSNLIERAKELEVFDLPLCAMFTGSNIWNPIESAYSLAVHMKRVQEASLDFPIILDAEGFVMDGWHRVAKALLEGRATIKAVRFDETPAPDYTAAE